MSLLDNPDHVQQMLQILMAPSRAGSPARTPPVPPAQQQDLVQRVVQKGHLSSTIAFKMLEPLVGESGRAIADALMESLMSELEPGSVVERLLAEQLVLLHIQTLMVSLRMANVRGNSLDDLDKLSTMTGRLQTEFRKHLMAAKSWRMPDRPLIVSRQTNIGAQQIIQQTQPGEPTNEQGAKDA